MNKEELLIALHDWKTELSDSEFQSWQEYKTNGTYSIDLITHDNDERITAIYFFCGDVMQSIKERYK